MAEPKKKTSKSLTRSRRHQIHLDMPTIIYCDKCHEPKLRHRICKGCGSYKGKDINPQTNS